MIASISRPVLFQSTLPVWGATQHTAPICIVEDISIHAPRVGSDIAAASFPARLFISIHAPRVGSDSSKAAAQKKMLISIHAPRVGSDFNALTSRNIDGVFQSTLPVWGATAA